MRSGFLLLLLFAQATGQGQDIKRNRYTVLRHQYNSFIADTGIVWACEVHKNHVFAGTGNQFSLHDYMRDAQRKGMIKSYKTTDDTYYSADCNKRKVDDYFVEVRKEINNEFQYANDSMKLIGIREIFYYTSHTLYSYVVTAAPLFDFRTNSGIYLGSIESALSSLNLSPGTISSGDDEILSMGRTYSILDFDSLWERGGLKQTYGQTLSLLLWAELSAGYNIARDLKADTIIAPARIMDISPFDSSVFYMDCDDSLGAGTCLYKMPGTPAYEYFNAVGIYQDWFYNKTKDVFFTKIPKLDIYIRYHVNENDSLPITREKRYEVTFNEPGAR